MPNIVLQTEHLTKRYGDTVAVKDLSLAIVEGEVFGFLGPNGAGKSTSIHMMCGLLRPDASRVLVHGVPIDGGSADVRQRVGMCPQNIVLWERLTCLEQLVFVGQMYGLRGPAARLAGERLLTDFDLLDKKHKQARTLSGGMQRRLSLALALVHDPDIVVLDEPEAGLDPQSRIKVREYIRSLAHRKTIIVTTHNMDEADRVADRVAIIDHGELLVLDTPEALKRRLGEGDVLEISLPHRAEYQTDQQIAASSTELRERLRRALSEVDGVNGVDVAAGTLTVRALGAVNLLGRILSALSGVGIRAGEVRLRENSLEDVFIQLTGRRLRE